MRKTKLYLLLTIFSLIMLSSCSKFFTKENIDTSIADDPGVYIDDSIADVKELYITVLEPKKNDKDYNYTLSQLNSDVIDETVKDDPEVKIIFQEGKDGVIRKDDYGIGLSQYNATMKLRGQSARLSDLKSYKIELNSKAPWDGFVTVNLNKHPYDELRIRNKLTFELIKEVPNITSARTQFVHLFVKDFSEGNYSNPYVDYGLFTQIENIDKDYLENHGLDRNGNLYKVENFEFKRYEDILRNVDDKKYDENDFEDILEIKSGESHEKLLKMLDDVNNDYININKVVDTHFDRDNFLTWLALNIITDNVDTQSRNYFLYSPSDSDIWYFLPWDYDKGLGGYSTLRPIWTKGVSNYWGNVLINRFLRNTNNFNALTQKVEELSTIINQDLVNTYVDLYKPISMEYIYRYPDILINGDADDREEIEEDYEELRNAISVHKAEYYKSIERPMPVFLSNPYITGNFMEFDWSKSYDFQNDHIFYSFELSDSPFFETLIYEEKDLLNNEIIVKKIPPGHYYYRIFITDENGNKSDAFDIYIDDETMIYCYGVKDFFVN